LRTQQDEKLISKGAFMKKQDISSPRRTWLKKAIVLTVAATALPEFAFSDSKEAKASKSAVQYQDHPKPGKMCGMCKYFIPPGATSPGKGMMGAGMSAMMNCQNGSCQVVAGQISAMAYCILYSPIPA
jgi:hypothetical protein